MLFRLVLLVGITALLVVSAVVSSLAQSTPLVDYDLDDDGLIEVRDAGQWRAIHYDLDGDGTAESRNAPHFGTDSAYATAFPNPMAGMGCPARDHDDDPATPDEASCIGYELLSDINLSGGGIVIGAALPVYGWYSGTIVGNGFRILNNSRQNALIGLNGIVSSLQWGGVIEGIGVVNPTYSGNNGISGGIVARLEGSVIGSYVEGGSVVNGGFNGGIAARVATNATNGYGLIAHSYVRGARVGSISTNNGGLAGRFEQQRGTNRSTCLNSYFSGDVDATTGGGRSVGLIVGNNQSGQGRFINCVGDSTTDSSDGANSVTATGAGTGTTAATNAIMTAPTGYTGPFANWDDYPIDGGITQLSASAPRTDAWHFGDGTNLPVLKAWGHDMTLPLDRALSGTDTVNLCTRTREVANEIIRLLKDDTFADGVTGPVPADVAALTDCLSSSDTRSVTIDDLRDYAVTTASNPLTINPNRTSPIARKIASLDMNDFAYLVNVSHIDLSSNSLTTLAPRLFQGLPLRWLDLSDNKLTTLPADLFADLNTTATSGSLAHPPASPATFAGGQVFLNGNELTDSGIPGRIFDDLSEINGLDLSDNKLTRVNTRWFEQLVNLGNRPASNTALQPGLGLHLAGNAITEHHYTTKLFTGVRENVARYTGTSAGDDLKAAIVAAITAEAGGTTPTTLDLDTTDYYMRAGSNAGYLPSGMTCPSGATVGSGRLDYLSSAMPDCYVEPHWSAPTPPGAAATPDPMVGVEQDGTRLVVTFSHTESAGFIGYQVRYRVLPADPNSDYCITYQQVLQVCYEELPDEPTEGWTQDWIYVAISQSSGTKTVEIRDIDADTRHQVQVRALSRTGPMSETVVAAETPTNVELEQELATGALKLSWDSPNHYIPAAYEYRTRAVGSAAWSAWTRVNHEGARGARQEAYVGGLTYGLEYEFQLRVLGVATTSQTAGLTTETHSGLPKVDSIKPTIREISVRAGASIMLAVDVYNAQQALDNDLPTELDGDLVFSWSEVGAGGGSFTPPANSRRVTYTAPNLPGRYTVTAEAQPDGICMSHHDGAAEITAEDRAPCIATFTISVSAAPSIAGPRPEPVNPTGVIPTSMTDDAGKQYAVFTPVDGGTFTSEGISVSAPTGAVPDRTVLGVNAAESTIPVPPPIPGASMSLAGSFYDVNAITQDGSAPLANYTLNYPLTICLPYPAAFRAELTNVVAVERNANGELGILTTRVRSNAGALTVCGAISTLPATVGVAKLGTVPAIPATPTPAEPLPETGGVAPSAIAVALMLLAGVLLKGMYRMRRIIHPLS